MVSFDGLDSGSLSLEIQDLEDRYARVTLEEEEDSGVVILDPNEEDNSGCIDLH